MKICTEYLVPAHAERFVWAPQDLILVIFSPAHLPFTYADGTHALLGIQDRTSQVGRMDQS
jgi:hypothetical protein